MNIFSKKIVILLIIFCFDTAWSKFVTTDTSGKEVEIIFPETPYRSFQKSFSFDAYQKLDQMDRSYALPELLIASMDPNSPLDSVKKTNVQNILSQHFYTLPSDVAKELSDKAIWMAFLSGNRGLSEALVKKFVPVYPKERTDEFCKMARTSITMMTYSGTEPTAKEFLQLPDKVLQLFSSLLNSGVALTDDKCKLSKKDTDPLSLKQLVQEISKKFSKIESSAGVKSTAPVVQKTVCKISEVKNIFSEAIEKIEKYGQSHKVYLGVDTMKCPIYGVVAQSVKKQFRFYPNSYREDVVPPIVFTSAEDIVSNFIIVDKPAVQQQPQSKTPAGATR